MRPDGDGNHHIEWLNGFAVKSTARKQGIGSALLETALTNIESTTTAIKLITLDRFQTAVGLYKKANFEIIEE